MTNDNSETDRRYGQRGHPVRCSDRAGRDRFGPGFCEWHERGSGGRDPRDFGAFRASFGHGGWRERLFDAGDFRLIILRLLSEQPSYGYQLIKTLEQRLAGGYSPSAGVVYPTLTMLEEEGLATVSQEQGKKIYSVTPEGIRYLEANEDRVRAMLDRLEDAGRHFQRHRSPEIMKAFGNLGRTVFTKISREEVTPEDISKITETINAAAKTIDEL